MRSMFTSWMLPSRAVLAVAFSVLAGHHGAVPTTARERVRAELTAEITEAARRQLGEVGAAALSLRAVARELGMASSALYRYFPSRDDLLTRLIIDGYDALGGAAEKADDPVANYLADIFTLPASLAGLPGMSLPCGAGAGDMPVGLQLIGNYFGEARLLNAAHRFQQDTDFHLRKPQGF